MRRRKTMESKTKVEEVALMVLKAKAVDIRDIPPHASYDEAMKLPSENQPFLYASGNWGPGYVSIKNLVGRKRIIKSLAQQLAELIAEKFSRLDFVAGNVTGGVIPGWLLSEYLEMSLRRTIPFVYIREARKKGGQKELITGIANNPEISPGANGLVIEELVNFAETTCNGAEALRDAGYVVTHAATILFYNNPEAIKALKEHEIEMLYLFTLPDLLTVAEKYKTHPQKAIDGYREFLVDPLGWQTARRLKRVERGGTI
jgi:orotate phosphoribosyltransferase